MAEDNVILVTFEEESKAYQAASVLKQADLEGRIVLQAIAIVQRTEDGTLRVKEGEVDDFPVATWTATTIGAATGGLIGLTLGVLGAPLGLLLGGVWGAQPGTTALIAEVTEPTTEVVDTEMERLGGVVIRRPVVEVEAELAAAEEATRAAEEEARRKLREEREPGLKEKAQQKIDELKTRLGSS
jgi:hypothetical protein